MRRLPRCARVPVALSVATAVALGAVLLLPGRVAGPRPQVISAAAAASRPPGGLAPARGPTASGAGQPFAGTAAVGALFTLRAGQLGPHFCTATVVHSAGGDLAVTAAHCLAGVSGTTVFVPGYASGQAPYGRWRVTAVYTDQAWQSAQDPDDDVAFLRLSGSGGQPVERLTGAERLGASPPRPTLVQVVGYPDGAPQPILCANWATHFSPTQLEFNCDNYTDGSSGGPFLADVSAASGLGTVIGVIGGYQQGGDSPEVSYAAAFGPAVTALYQRAQAAG